MNDVSIPPMRLLLIALYSLICFAPPSHGADWPNYHGPEHDNHYKQSDWSTQWENNTPRNIWEAQVGTGFSSVSIVGDRVYTMGHKNGKDSVIALSFNSGEELWRHSYDSDLGPNLYEGGPGSTPTVHKGHVFAISRWGDLFSLNAADGSLNWKRQLAKEEEVRIPEWGFNGSCLVSGDLIIVTAAANGIAFDKNTGKTVWKSDDGEAGYVSPTPVSIDGREQVVVSSGDAYTGINPTDGAVIWQIPWFTRYGVNAAAPIVRNNKVFISSGYSKGAGLFEIEGQNTKQLWKHRKFRNQLNTSALIGDHLYGFDGDNSSRAFFKCVDWDTGKDLWDTEEPGFGSLLQAGDKLILLSDKGVLITVDPSPDSYKPLSKTKVIDGRCWTALVLTDSRLFVRNSTGRLICLDVSKSH